MKERDDSLFERVIDSLISNGNTVSNNSSDSGDNSTSDGKKAAET